MRYPKSPWAQIAEHGDDLELHYQKFATTTGYSGEATAILIAAAMRRAA